MFDVEFKRNFFDRAKVERAIARAERAVLSRFGAYVRQRAKTSMRRRKGVSEPGAPPSAHVGLVRDFVYFAYEPDRHDVIIGPALLGRPGTRAPLSGGGVLRLLEEGGTVERIMSHMLGGRKRMLHYRPRPFMRPAFDAELKARMPSLFKDSVKE
jgi:hypothetical protein